jgi:hypothetical protein
MIFPKPQQDRSKYSPDQCSGKGAAARRLRVRERQQSKSINSARNWLRQQKEAA